MDIQSRKIEFIQSFLRLQSEEAISQLESLLKKSVKVDLESHFKPFSVKELDQRAAKSEEDFDNNKFKTSSELLEKY